MVADEDCGKIAEVKPQPSLLLGNLFQSRVGARREQRQDDEEDDQGAVVEREDAQDAAGVEVPQPAGRPLGVIEDAGDQESGQDEEEVHAAPSRAGQARKPECGAGYSVLGRTAEVDHHDHEDRQAAEAIEAGEAGAFKWVAALGRIRGGALVA